MGQACSSTALQIDSDEKRAIRDSNISLPTTSDYKSFNCRRVSCLKNNKKTRNLVGKKTTDSAAKLIDCRNVGPRMDIQGLNLILPCQEDGGIRSEDISPGSGDKLSVKLEKAFNLIDSDKDGKIATSDLVRFLLDQDHLAAEIDSGSLKSHVARLFCSIHGSTPGMWTIQEFTIFMNKKYSKA